MFRADMGARSSQRVPTIAGGRGRVALGLIVTVLALAVFTASHIHGVSDPHAHHSLVDFLIFAQAHSGFLVACLLAILFVFMTVGRIRGESRGTRRDGLMHAFPCRAPPLSA